MQIERRVLYNSLRMNWLCNPALKVQPWQVEDYRSLPTETLLFSLAKNQIIFDKQSFQLFAENVDSPEELTDELIADSDLDNEHQDLVFLLVFELWRRFIPEKKCLSIFLDELDHQIFLYDHGQIKDVELIQDCIEELSLILDENIDSGVDPKSIFETISTACANDLESFLYDFISEQIDNNNLSYASELLDNFNRFIKEPRWFAFLRAKIQAADDVLGANEVIRKLLHENKKDLEFNLELLSFVTKSGEHDLLISLIKKSLPLLQLEEDFIDLATLTIEYFDRLDLDLKKQALEKIVNSRREISFQTNFLQNDPQAKKLLKICETIGDIKDE